METNKDMTTYIYESPDGGDTVYRRKFGSDPMDREFHWQSERKKTWDLRQARQNLWHDILGASDQDPALKEMLDRVEIYYRMKSQP